MHNRNLLLRIWPGSSSDMVTPAAVALSFLFLLAPLSAASSIVLSPHSTDALRQFAEVFALPMLDAHAELSMRTVVLSIVPLSAALDGDGVQPWLLQLSSSCNIHLPSLQQQHRQHLVALCSWQASADTSHFLTLRSSDRPATPPPPSTTAFAVFGASVKGLREGLTWLMRHTLLPYDASPAYGWMPPLGSSEPWTSLRSTQFPTSMTTMPMPLLQQ